MNWIERPDCAKQASAINLLLSLTSSPPVRAFTCGNLRVLLSHDPGGWHLSISHPSRYPTWDELKEARYDLIPDGCYMAQILPPRSEYVNVHPNCFHLVEIPSEVGR